MLDYELHLNARVLGFQPYNKPELDLWWLIIGIVLMSCVVHYKLVFRANWPIWNKNVVQKDVNYNKNVIEIQIPK